MGKQNTYAETVSYRAAMGYRGLAPSRPKRKLIALIRDALRR